MSDYEYEVQGDYESCDRCGECSYWGSPPTWECVTTESTRSEALKRLAEYREAEPGVQFRVRKVKVES